MFRKLIGIFVATVLLTFQLFVGNATATELDEATRTVPLNDQGDQIVLTVKEVKQGKRLFSAICASKNSSFDIPLYWNVC